MGAHELLRKITGDARHEGVEGVVLTVNYQGTSFIHYVVHNELREEARLSYRDARDLLTVIRQEAHVGETTTDMSEGLLVYRRPAEYWKVFVIASEGKTEVLLRYIPGDLAEAVATLRLPRSPSPLKAAAKIERVA